MQALTIGAVVLVCASALVCALLILALRPWLVRYALARPNVRSSHRMPTPQGGGAAVVFALTATALAALAFGPPSSTGGAGAELFFELAVVLASVIVMAAVGAVDDLRPLSAGLRLVLQALIVTGVVLAAGPGRLLPEPVPFWLERGLAVLAGVWFVNLVNFMDGLDWMTVAEMVPLATFCGLALAALDVPAGAIVAFALLGALIGFAPFNKPVAGLFLGDVGSLPIGLVAAWLLYQLALAGGLAAALLLPLYHLADATSTLLRRLVRGEKVWQAHRSHFYQRATDHGFTVLEVIARVFVLNLALAGLALTTLVWSAPGWTAAALALGAGLVAFVLARFSTPRRVPSGPGGRAA